MNTLQRLLAGTVAGVVLAASVVLVVDRTPNLNAIANSVLIPGRASAPPLPGPLDPVAVVAAQRFLTDYVEAEGQVVRRDQGGDTVSEGQAYGLLLAVAADDRPRFTTVWEWTKTHLLRPDGLLSWRWRGGAVVDGESAADADLTAARALVLAGDRFGSAALAQDGRTLAAAIIDHETVQTPEGLVLTAGSWVRSAPWTINPSYFSPRANSALAAATGDPRWVQLQRGNTAVTRGLLAEHPLLPDWAAVNANGDTDATAAPDGTAPQFSADAARSVLRAAESCSATDRAIAATAAASLGQPVDVLRGSYTLDGAATVNWQHPLVLAASAATHTANGDRIGAAVALDAAAQLDKLAPTFYGEAWVALGRVVLQTTLLGSCAGQAT